MYRTCLLGSASVGKTSLVTQCLTSDYMNTYDASLGNSSYLVLKGHANERDFSFSSVYKSTRQRTLPRILQIFRFHIHKSKIDIPLKKKKLTTVQMIKGLVAGATLFYICTNIH
jgi:GTPase SAR1 family protein